jgi:hypothetical protein
MTTFNSSAIVDAVLAQLVEQLVPAVTEAVGAKLKQQIAAEGMGVLALAPETLQPPVLELLQDDSEIVEHIERTAREEARNVFQSENDVTDTVREYLHNHLDDAIERVMSDEDYVKSSDVEDNVDLDNFGDFTDLVERVDALENARDGERSDSPNPFYNEHDNCIRKEFVQAVRDALTVIANGNSSRI